jgi:hypothetical protein
VGRTGGAAVRTWAAFGLAPVTLSLILFWLYRTRAFGENSDPAAWVLLLAFAGLAAWLGRPGAEGLLAGLQAPIARHGHRGLALVVLVAFGLYLAIARLVLDAFPNSGDEIAYVLQAQTYAQGRPWADPPAASAALDLTRFFDVRGHWLSQYPPGWALVLAPAAALGAPLWIVDPAIGALALAVFYALARRHVSREVAGLSVLALGFSAFYALNAASYFNHVFTLLCALAFALFGERFLDRGRAPDALLAGLCIGVLGFTRTQTAVPFVLAFLFMLAAKPDRRLGVVWFGLGGLPLLGALLAYNAATTGHPLTPPQNVLGEEPLGRPGVAALVMSLKRIVRLHAWTSPILLYGAAAAFLVLARRRALGLSDWIMPLTVAMFLAYAGDGGNQYGPRYYFEAWPFAILTLAKVAAGLLTSPDPRIRQWTASAAVAVLAFQIAYLPPRLEREHRVVAERQAVFRAVQAAGLTRAIVIIDGPVGKVRSMDPGDLVRNGLDVGARGVIYAHAAPGGDAELIRAYPRRTLYAYRDGRLARR